MILLILFLFFQIHPLSFNDSEPQVIYQPMNRGEAFIWYLGHSGWAIKTKSSILIFDFVDFGYKSKDSTIPDGLFNHGEVADQNIYVFVSHAHADHYDQNIFNLKPATNRINYIFGWKETGGYTGIVFGEQRERKVIGNLEVYNIFHSFDGIPESAFLVSVDGITLFHAGDHGHSKEEENPVFRDNIEYLASLQKDIDIMFLPTFGGEKYSIKKLSPKVVFPMHNGGNEKQYILFGKRVRDYGFDVVICLAEEPGDLFHYYEGELKKQ